MLSILHELHLFQVFLNCKELVSVSVQIHSLMNCNLLCQRSKIEGGEGCYMIPVFKVRN